VLPSNAAAFVGILTSLATVLMWFLYDWQGHYNRLIVQKDPVTWVLLIMFVGLAVTNYLMEDRQTAKTMLDATKTVTLPRR
jgi:putative Ca2+/H+ antiporter (TMEM165/GDT1 family)